MKLKQATRFFDRTPIKDGYTSADLGVGQFDLYDEVTQDSPSIQRRVLEVNPGKVTLPARGVIEAGKYSYIVSGYVHEDFFNGEVIRTKAVVHRAHGLAMKQTPEELLSQVNSGNVYAGLAYFQAESRQVPGREEFPVYHLYTAMTEPLAVGEILTFTDISLRVSDSYLSEAGFIVSTADQLVKAPLTVEVTDEGVYDPVSDTIPSTTNNYSALAFAVWHAHESPNPSTHEIRASDLIVMIRLTDLPSLPIGAELTMEGTTYRVISSEEELGCLKLRVRA